MIVLLDLMSYIVEIVISTLILAVGRILVLDSLLGSEIKDLEKDLQRKVLLLITQLKQLQVQNFGSQDRNFKLEDQYTILTTISLSIEQFICHKNQND